MTVLWVRCRAVVLAGAVVLAACSGSEPSAAPSADPSPSSPDVTQDGTFGGDRTVDGGGPDAPSTTPPDATQPDPTPSDQTQPDELPVPTDAELAAAGVDELGRVPVLAWHYVTDAEDGRYRTSRATLRAQLQDLHDRGYRPVTQAEFAAGTFPIPFGTSPVVLTFDDSTRGQFALTDDGEVDPETAVGVMEAFAAQHDDWRATAVFSINFPQPFGGPGFEPGLRWLHEHGYEFANHSYGHVSLAPLDGDAIAENLARNTAALREAVPGADFGSLTLPFGSRSGDRSAELRGASGGVTYEHALVYLFGAYPNRSPHDVAHDPLEVQRIPATATAGEGVEWLTDRLDELEEDGTRFVSDGDPAVVTVPADRLDDLDLDLDPASAAVRTYGASPPG